VNGVRLKQERRGDTEVSAATADGPEQITIFIGARNDKSSIGQDNIGGQQIIDGQAVLSCEVSDAATKG
jgi:hypothetical protein